MNVPHPLPYQGSKRKLAPLIGEFIERNVSTWYEPFAGSIAMTIWAVNHNVAKHYVIGDSLIPICYLWKAIINSPESVSGRYAEIWRGQKPGDHNYFNQVRERYNSNQDPVDLLYLICRCVKNAVRFNRCGNFTQSADKRRVGMNPEKMRKAVFAVSSLLKGKAEVRTGDWQKTISDVSPEDYVYLDPPYLGTSVGRDKRYAHQMERDILVAGLVKLIRSGIPFSLSYDGTTGGREYGPPLPEELGMTRLLLDAGISAQSTLNGKIEKTVESLYVWPAIIKHENVIMQTRNDAQVSLNL